MEFLISFLKIFSHVFSHLSEKLSTWFLKPKIIISTFVLSFTLLLTSNKKVLSFFLLSGSQLCLLQPMYVLPHFSFSKPSSFPQFHNLLICFHSVSFQFVPYTMVSVIFTYLFSNAVPFFMML